MKIMSIVRLATLSLLMMFVQHVHCARTSVGTQGPAGAAVQKIVDTAVAVGQEKGGLSAAFIESDFIIKKSTEIMDKARGHLLNKDTTQAEDFENVKIIIEHNKAIVMAQQKLEKMRDEIAKNVEKGIVSEGYWDKFVSGVKSVGTGIASFFTTGIGTEEEKSTARLIIKGLTEQEVKITEKYALLQKDLTAAEKVQLKSRYDLIIAYIEAVIYEQQIITGDTKSSMIKRGLLLGAAAAGTVATGALLKNKYFGTEEEPEVPEYDIAEIVELGKQAIGQGVEKIKSFVPTAESIRKNEEEREAALKTIGEGFKKTGEVVGTALREAHESMETRRGGSNVPTVGQIWDAGGKKAVETVIESAGKGIKERTEAPTIPQLWEGGKKIAREAREKVGGYLNKDSGESESEGDEEIMDIKNVPVPTFSQIREGAKESGITGAAQKAYESTKAGAQKVYASTKEKIPSASQVWQSAKDLTNTAENKLREYLTNEDLEKEGLSEEEKVE